MLQPMGLQRVSSLCHVAKILELQHQPSNAYLGLISFRIDWFDLLAVQGTLKNLLQHQFKGINSSVGRQALLSMGLPRQELLEWVAIFLLQGIFPTQGSNVSLALAGRFFTN